MAQSISLQDMSIEEKLEVMELIWDDLCDHAERLPSPDWHGGVLAEREIAIERGDDEFEEWETAKNKIDQSIR